MSERVPFVPEKISHSEWQMQTMNHQQMTDFLQGRVGSLSEQKHSYGEVFDHCTQLLQGRFEQDLAGQLIQYSGEQYENMDFSHKMKLQSILQQHNPHIIPLERPRAMAATLCLRTLFDSLYLIVSSVHTDTQNYPISKKAMRTLLGNYTTFQPYLPGEAEADGCTEAARLTPQLIQALFFNQYFKHEQTRYYIAQLSLVKLYQPNVERCVLTIGHFNNKQGEVNQFVQELYKVNHPLVKHIIAQLMKTNSKSRFTRAIRPYLPLNSIGSLFTQIIQEKINCSSPSIQRNCMLVLEELFPTSQAQIEINAEVKNLHQCMLSSVPVVRQQAVQAVGQIINRFADQLQTGQLQQLFDQLVVLCFDNCRPVRNRALQQLIKLFANEQIQDAVLSAIQVNLEQFKGLLALDDRKTKNSLVQLFLLVQQEDAKRQVSENRNYTTTAGDTQQGQAITFKEFLLDQMAQLSGQSTDFLFPGRLDSFIDTPEFCYEQIYVGSTVCRAYLNECIGELVKDGLGAELLILGLYYQADNMRSVYLNGSRDDFVSFMRDNQINDRLMCLASLMHIVIQVLTNNIAINDYLFVTMLAVVQAVLFVRVMGGHNQFVANQVRDFTQFAFQGFTTAFIAKMVVHCQNVPYLDLVCSEIVRLVGELAGKQYDHMPAVQPSDLSCITSCSQRELQLVSQVVYKVQSLGLQLLAYSVAARQIQELQEGGQNDVIQTMLVGTREALHTQIQLITDTLVPQQYIKPFDAFCIIFKNMALLKPEEVLHGTAKEVIAKVDINAIDVRQVQQYLQILVDLYVVFQDQELVSAIEQVYERQQTGYGMCTFTLMQLIRYGYEDLIGRLVDMVQDKPELRTAVEKSIEEDSR